MTHISEIAVIIYTLLLYKRNKIGYSEIRQCRHRLVDDCSSCACHRNALVHRRLMHHDGPHHPRGWHWLASSLQGSKASCGYGNDRASETVFVCEGPSAVLVTAVLFDVRTIHRRCFRKAFGHWGLSTARAHAHIHQQDSYSGAAATTALLAAAIAAVG